MKLSNRFRGHLRRLAGEFPGLVQGPFGLGAMIGFTYCDGSVKETAKLVKRLYDNGLMSFSAGQDPSRIRFLIPVGAVTNRDIDEACKIIKKTLKELNGR